MIETAPSLFVLKKPVAYLLAFVEYFKRCKVKKERFVKPKFDTVKLDEAMFAIVGYAQHRHYSQALSILQSKSFEDLSHAINRCSRRESGKLKVWLNELRFLNKFRSCVDKEGLLRMEGRLSNSPDLTEDMKHPLILPSRSALTRLVVLQYHEDNFHVGVQNILLSTRKRFWIVNGHASVKHYIIQCAKCTLDKAKPIRQLMADLPVCRTSTCHKAFKICGLDYFGPVSYVVGRSTRKT